MLSVQLINSYGDDQTPVRAARVSTLSDSSPTDPERDLKLARYLLAHGHTSPFEHAGASFLIACPIFSARQIQRHRTFSYNEVSRRYTSKAIEIYTPDTFYIQHPRALQCSDEDTPHFDQEQCSDLLTAAYDNALATYHELLQQGVSREIARAVLPLATMTQFYMSGNLLNWIKFLKLRLDKHSQRETRNIANAIHCHLTAIFPQTMALADELVIMKDDDK